MDLLIPLLIVAIFYLGPALLKYYRSPINKNVELHESLVPEIKAVPSKSKREPKHVAHTTELQSTIATANAQSVPSIRADASPWNDKLDHNMMINGVIFAEILQPPRAYRPFGRHFK